MPTITDFAAVQNFEVNPKMVNVKGICHFSKTPTPVLSLFQYTRWFKYDRDWFFFFVSIIAHHSSNSQRGLNRF